MVSRESSAPGALVGVGRLTTSPHPIPKVAFAPSTVTRGTEWRLPLGLCDRRREAVWDTIASPNAAFVGKTGSGKSVALTTIAMGALLRGWQLAIAETTKVGLDFLPLRPWCAGWATDLPSTVDMLDDVCAEVVRRRIVLRSMVKKPPGLPRGSRPAPMLILIDEFFPMVAPIKSTTDEAMAMNALKARVSRRVSWLIKNARFADVHLALGMHRPHVTALFSEIKANTGTWVLCSNADPIVRQMVLRDADRAPMVEPIRGRALVETDEHDAEQMQVYLSTVAPSARLPRRTPVVPTVLQEARVGYAAALPRCREPAGSCWPLAACARWVPAAIQGPFWRSVWAWLSMRLAGSGQRGFASLQGPDD